MMDLFSMDINIKDVFHSKDEFSRGKCHVNGIESFWSYAKRRLAQFNGLNDQKFIYTSKSLSLDSIIDTIILI